MKHGNSSRLEIEFYRFDEAERNRGKRAKQDDAASIRGVGIANGESVGILPRPEDGFGIVIAEPLPISGFSLC
jgi:hypothetical protein